MFTAHVSRRTLLGSLAAGFALTASRSAFAAQTLEALKKAGEIRVGCEAAYVPFTYRDNTGKIVGFDVDFATRMFEPIGVKPQFIDTQWSGVIPALYAGRFDMVPTMSYTKERLERVRSAFADASRALVSRQGQDQDHRRHVGQVLSIKLNSPGETLKKQARTKTERRRGLVRQDYDDHRRLSGAEAGRSTACPTTFRPWPWCW